MNRTNKRTRAAADASKDSTVPRYTVAAVAERLGVPTATLRSWNQRYGVGPARHRRGQHRLYSEADIAVAAKMHALVGQGVSARGAAQTALDDALAARGDTETLLAAVFSFDVVAASSILDRHLRHYGVLETWEALVRPAFRAIETQQADGERCIDVEHVLSWSVTRCLQRLPIAVPDHHASIVLACTEHETHSLPLEALRAALAERDVGAVMLGAAVPGDAIVDAIARAASPTRAVLWAQSTGTADVDTVRAVVHSATNVILAGPGWKPATAKRAVRIASLQDGVQLLTSEAS